jgi:hypothetical protein
MLGIGVVIFGLGLVMAPLLGLLFGLVAAFSRKPRSFTSLLALLAYFSFPAILVVIVSFALSSVPIPLLLALQQLLFVVVLFLVPALLALATATVFKKLAACFRPNPRRIDNDAA